MGIFFRFLTMVVVVLCWAGCGQNEENPVKKITIADRSPEPAGVTLKIIEPVNGEVIPADSVLIKFSVANWNIEKDNGQICIILDDLPPVVFHTTDQPFVFRDVPTGPHAVRILLTNGSRESLKQKDAFALVQFYIKTEDAYPVMDDQKPMLVFNSPHGRYNGESSRKILFDFWVNNADLSADGYKVKYNLDGEEHVLTEWKPVYFEHLEPGSHRLIIDLVDGEGQNIAGNFNHIEREFTIETGDN